MGSGRASLQVVYKPSASSGETASEFYFPDMGGRGECLYSEAVVESRKTGKRKEVREKKEAGEMY
jgi:hypothetical protein